jgi:dihydrofolate reductase
MQAPGLPEEGFTHGGWGVERNGDEAVMRAWGQQLSASSGYLLGRRTYQEVLGYWNTQDSPFRDALNNAPKYVASNTLAEPLPWPNSTPLRGDIPAAVAELRKTPGNALHIMGSGALIQTLAPYGLIDEYLLCIHPIVLGTGRRQFASGFPPTTFDLAGATPTTTGIIIVTYRSRPSEPSSGAST